VSIPCRQFKTEGRKEVKREGTNKENYRTRNKEGREVIKRRKN
jgi:hypothetical protein